MSKSDNKHKSTFFICDNKQEIIQEEAKGISVNNAVIDKRLKVIRQCLDNETHKARYGFYSEKLCTFDQLNNEVDSVDR